MSDYTNAQYLAGIAAGNVYTYRGRELRVSGDVPSDAQIAIDDAAAAATNAPGLGVANVFQAQQQVTLADTGTTTVVTGFGVSHQTSGTPAAGFGVSTHYQAQDTTTVDVDQATIVASWVTATHATRKARLAISAYDTAAREGVRVEATGTAPAVGFYGHAAAAQATVAGSRGSNAALASLLTALAAIGLIVDGSS